VDSKNLLARDKRIRKLETRAAKAMNEVEREHRIIHGVSKNTAAIAITALLDSIEAKLDRIASNQKVLLWSLKRKGVRNAR